VLFYSNQHDFFIERETPALKMGRTPSLGESRDLMFFLPGPGNSSELRVNFLQLFYSSFIRENTTLSMIVVVSGGSVYLR
jgi:hypothetical protein